MKKHIFCLLATIVLSTLFCVKTFAQTPTTIKTPLPHDCIVWFNLNRNL